jgi:beta-glucosidase
MRWSGALVALLLAVAAAGALAQGESGKAMRYLDPGAPLEKRVADLLERLTLEEKIALMAGASNFTTEPIQRLGIPALSLSDGPNGVRSVDGRATTAFPTGSALAATWSPPVVRAVGEAIGREARALGVAVMLGPNVNIQRVPLAGRNFEDYSEDPLLSGRMGVAMVQGIQSQGVGATVKHFVGNEQELERLRSDSRIDERTLHEIYLRPFEMVIAEAHPWAAMVSYNRLNGAFMSENRLIKEVLEGEWAYDGLVMSDWGAVHSTVAAARSGLALEMPGPAKYYGRSLTAAVRQGQVDTKSVEEAARRMVRLILRSGVLDGKLRPEGELHSVRNHAAALDAALESVVLLKNERALLPLDRAQLKTLAVIGPNADVPLYGGGGSSRITPEDGDAPGHGQTPLKELQGLLPSTRVVYARGVDNDEVAPHIDSRMLLPASVKPGAPRHGLSYEYFPNRNFHGPAVAGGVETDFDKVGLAPQLLQMSARWEGFLDAPDSGTYEISVAASGEATVDIDGKRVIGAQQGTPLPALLDFGPGRRVASIELTAGHRYPLRVEYVSQGVFHTMHLALRRPPPSFEAAVAAARGADAAILLVGSSRTTETEGRDRSTFALSARQDELVDAVLAANPRTIVVLQSGSPYELPWADKAPAIVEAWLDGEQGPLALAQILLGDASPSGRLPVTFPRRLADSPTQLYYPARKEVDYGEGVFVGYRGYERRQLEPLFPFGHGLSYTSFEYSNLVVSAAMTAAAPLQVSLQVRNSGKRPGKETVQLYVGDAATTDVVRPVKELKAFEKVALAPGETRTVRFTLSPADLAYYDETAHRWVSTPGTYHLFIGSSSRDLRLKQDFQWAS